MHTSRLRDQDRDRPGGGRHQGEGEHPSFLALDRAALGSQTAATTRHLAECARCRAHVDSIAAAPALPAEVVRPRRPQPVRPLPARRAWLGGLTASAAVAVVVLLVLLPREQPTPIAVPFQADPRFDTAKGGRAVGVYVRRGRHTFLWNGSEPIQPGDAIRLKLVPDGMSEVHVFSEADDPRRTLTLLHRATIPRDRDTLLDAAWQIDAAGAREVLVVVLSRSPLSPTGARDAARSGRMGEDVWVARLVLAKRPADSSAVPDLEPEPARAGKVDP
jgi:hypothetical protein